MRGMKIMGKSVFKFTGLVLGIIVPLSFSQAKELARVNESVISDQDLASELNTLNEGQRDTMLKDLNSRRQILLSIIDREVLSQEAEKLKLDQEPEFKQAMAQYRKQLLTSRLTQKKVAPQATEKAVKKYYEAHKYKYSPDMAHVQQILVADESEAKRLLEKAKDSKNDFQELAEKFSRDPSAKNNRGDLGYINRRQFVREFTDAIFDSAEGEITGPVKTIYGYHIIKVIDKKLGKPLEFDEAQIQASQDLREELLRSYIDNLKTQNKIKIDKVALEKY